MSARTKRKWSASWSIRSFAIGAESIPYTKKPKWAVSRGKAVGRQLTIGRLEDALNFY